MGKKLPLLHTLHLEAQPIPYITFRSEIMPFEVVDLKSPYHALFGRPADVGVDGGECSSPSTMPTSTLDTLKGNYGLGLTSKCRVCRSGSLFPHECDSRV